MIWNEDLSFSPAYNGSDRPFRAGTSDGFAGTINRDVDNSARTRKSEIRLRRRVEMIGLLRNLIH